MPEQLLCFTAGERLLVMGERGQATVYTVLASGQLDPAPMGEAMWRESEVSNLLREAVEGDEEARTLVRQLAGLPPGGHEETVWQMDNDETVAMKPVSEVPPA